MPLELDHVARLVETIGRRVSFPVDPLPGEGLPDLLFRAASENGYPTVSTLARMLGLTTQIPLLSPTAIVNNLEILDVDKLTMVLGSANRTSLDEIFYKKSARGQKHIIFYGREVRWNKFFAKTRRVSPLSLRRSLHQKAVWSVRGLSFDPLTREKLLWRCPDCKVPLSGWHSYGVEVCGLCFKAGKLFDLRTCPQGLVEVDDEEALSFVTNLIDPEIPLKCTSSLPIPEELAEFGPGPLFDLAIGLARQISKHDQSIDQSFDAGVPAEKIARAGRAILGWPDKFAEFADEVLQFHMDNIIRGPFDLRKLSEKGTGVFHHNVLHHPIRFVCSKEDTLLYDKVAEAARTSREKRIFESLSTLLNTQPTLLQIEPPSRTLIETGFTKQDRRTVRRRVVEMHSYLRLGTSENLSSFDARYMIVSGSRKMRRFAREIGIPMPFVLELIETNVAEIVDGEIDKILPREGSPPRTRLHDRLVASARRDTPAAEAVQLSSVCVLLKESINPWPALLEAMLCKKITYWITNGRSNLADRIWIRDLDTVKELLAELSPNPQLFDVPLQFDDQAFYLGVSSTAIFRLRRSGFLSDPTLRAARELRGQYTFIREIQRRLSSRGAMFTNSMVAFALEQMGIAAQVSIRGANLFDRKHVEEQFASPRAQLFINGQFRRLKLLAV
ncbi:hypothetical protein [Sinorhizobium sp. GL28]|uniref:hypothetical protein n=1 Tax=Sinorhizobium sp. GL28 TaxID=1358418 RepID=UPI00071C7CF2|nr:hypothetical protein [Sinorhizobium sp. GL28]KSV87549.1 hypothetical protein N184_30815 [Sinorhizobium sp. GL28]